MTEEDLSRLKQALVEMEEEEKKPNVSEKADQQFHEIIPSSYQNSAIESVIAWLCNLRNESALSTSFLARIRKEVIHPSIAEHKSIFEAISSRNLTRARAAMTRHIESATENAAQYFQKSDKKENGQLN